MIHFYCNVWEKRFNILALLIKLAVTINKKQCKCGNNQQKAFERAKEMLEQKVVLTYPDFFKPFDLYTNLSDV